MKKFYKYILSLGIVSIFWGLSFAQIQPDAFIVQVEPSSFDVGTPVDMTIKAVKANWDVIKDYEWDVFIDVEWALDFKDFVVPSQGLYTFIPQDQWQKTFSKWLIIKKAGTFTVTSSDISDDSIKWEKTVIVWTTNSSSDVKTITITSPIKNSTEKNEVLEVMWEASDLPNSPFEIYLNSQLSYKGTTSSVGNFTAYITGLKVGTNSLQAKVLDINNVILGESESFDFTFKSVTDWTFNSIQVLPGNTIKAGTKVTFRVSTSDSVTSATIKLSNWRSAPMDLSSAWSFTKDMVIDSEGKIDVSLDLIIDGSTKEYNNITRLISEKSMKIGKVRVFWDSVYKNKLTLTWEVEWWEAAKYSVVFWTRETELSWSAIVSKKEIILEDLTIGQTYYFKVSPLDIDGNIIGTSSSIVQAVVGEIGESLCTVQWIEILDTIIWDRHYLTRDTIQNVEKYIIYRSEFSTSDVEKMQKITETEETRFEYPFNKNAKQEKYSYYVVQAVCKDGKALVIQDVKKVQTWPMENILLFVFVAVFFYATYRLSLFNRVK